MTTVQEIMTGIENKAEFVQGSLIVQSMDERGAVFKWLENNFGSAERRKMFLQLDPAEKNVVLEQRTAIITIDVEPASG